MMNDDIYAPPMSDPAPEAPLTQETAGFHVVSPRKFWIMLLATVGLYEIYWFYQHWKVQKALRREPMWPVMRALFSIFFTHSLFRRIHAACDPKATPLSGLATCFVLLSVMETIASRLSVKEVGSPWTDLLGFVVIPLIGFCLVAAQKQANAACGDPEGSANDRLSGGNIVWIVIGLLIWCVSLFGLLAVFGVVPA